MVHVPPCLRGRRWWLIHWQVVYCAEQRPTEVVVGLAREEPREGRVGLMLRLHHVEEGWSGLNSVADCDSDALIDRLVGDGFAEVRLRLPWGEPLNRRTHA